MPADHITIADTECAEFVAVFNKLVDAGFASGNPFLDALGDFLPDATDKEFWSKRPSRMSVADIFEYVEARFGPWFVGFCKSRPEFTVH
jgi:hypothetical protein